MLGNVSIWQLLIVLVIVVLIFGTKRLRSLGKEAGGAVKEFRDALDHNEKKDQDLEAKVVDAEQTTDNKS